MQRHGKRLAGASWGAGVNDPAVRRVLHEERAERRETRVEGKRVPAPSHVDLDRCGRFVVSDVLRRLGSEGHGMLLRLPDD
jgi:hypothetical protein